MPAPGVDVTIAPAAVADGTLTSTNSAFLAYAAPSGPTGVATVASATQAVAAGLTGGPLQNVLDLLVCGVPQVLVSRVAITNPATAATVDADGWGEALDLFTDQLPMGQMLIPGVGTAAAHDALVAASQRSHRAAYLDAPQNATAEAVVALAEAQEDKSDTYATALWADYTTVAVPGGGVRAIPGSIGAAGATARRDVAVGHTNWMAAGVPNGLIPVGENVQTTRSRTDLDLFSEAGVNPTLVVDGGTYLYDFLSLTADPDWTALVNGSRSQLNFGRLAMQILGDTRRGLRQYLFAPGDSLTQAAAEDFLRAYLTNLWAKRALFPNDDASKAFSATVLGVTTDEDVRNQILRAAITMTPTPGIRSVTLVAAVNGVAA